MTDLGFDPDEEERLHDEAMGLRPIDGAALLDDVRNFVAKYVAFPSEHALDAVALWAAHTHAVGCFESTPRIAFLSPEPGSGKTRSLEVLELVTPRPLLALNASPAPIFRTIQQATPTLLFDEVDALWNKRGKDEANEDLRAMLNAGHRRGASIPRCVGPRHDVQLFPVCAPTALAGLGDLPETLMTRAVIIRMRKRAPDERVEPFRRRLAQPAGELLAQRLSIWATSVTLVLTDAWPDMPEGVTDRPADVWEALLAIADVAGGHWPKTARAACVELCKVAANREASLGVKLLDDLRTVFGEVNKLPTTTVLERLCALQESPWSDLRGKPLDASGLARRLRSYGISSIDVKVDEKTLKGYRREDLHDAWTRYLAPLPGKGQQGQPARPDTTWHTAHVAEVAHSQRNGSASFNIRSEEVI